MSTPVVLCGISKVMGGRVAPRLQPDFEGKVKPKKERSEKKKTLPTETNPPPPPK
jgi:hypothetical protein